MANYKLGPVIGKIGSNLETRQVTATTSGGDADHIHTIDPKGKETLVILVADLDYLGTSTSSFPSVRSSLHGEGRPSYGDLGGRWTINEPMSLTLINNSSRTPATLTGTLFILPL